MRVHDKRTDGKKIIAASLVSQMKDVPPKSRSIDDKRPVATVQRRLHEMVNNSPSMQRQARLQGMLDNRADDSPVQRYSISDEPKGKLSNSGKIFLDASQDNLYAAADFIDYADKAFSQAAVSFVQGGRAVKGLPNVLLQEREFTEGEESESYKNMVEDKGEFTEQISEDWLSDADTIIKFLQGAKEEQDIVSELGKATGQIKSLLDAVDFSFVINETENIESEIDHMIDYVNNEKNPDKLQLQSDCGLLAGMLLNVKGALVKAEEHEDVVFLDKAHPDVGEAYYITGKPKEGVGVNFHYGTAIMKDGTDIVTLEAYAPTMKEIPKLVMDKSWKWDMYGQEEENETFASKHSHYFE